MTNFVTNSVVYGSVQSEVYVPDQLVYDTRLAVTQAVTIGITAVPILRGTVISLATGLPSVSTSDTALAIVSSDIAASGSTQVASVYVAGEFNANGLRFDRVWGGLTTGTIIAGEEYGLPPVAQFATGVAALVPVFANSNIHLKVAVQATGPNYAGS